MPEIDEMLYSQLIDTIKTYHPSDDFSLVEKAYLFAKEAHKEQTRKSGEPYVIHPLSVAIILAETELDKETIAAGLLHDVIEDTDYSKQDIAEQFSPEVAELVDGVTKLEKYEYTSLEDKQAENYRKMFLAMASDIRVIIIKIADRLHNMRTLKFQRPEKQREIAQETLDIYCPLADRLGISTIRYELEDLAFRYIDPEAYFVLKEQIQMKQTERVAHVNKIVEELKVALAQNLIEGYVEGRPKHFFSIYKKMHNQNKTLEQIFDLFAVRIITNSIKDCYGALGVAHELYHHVPNRFKDYIAMPKPNMYQSLHSTLLGPEGEPFELQIRTWAMHRTCEFGIAAHWKYKAGKSGKFEKDQEDKKLVWLRQILEWQRESVDNKEYLDALKFDLNVYKDSIYCFTPKGAVISLLSGATPIDFAYQIHSAIGNKMVGAKVNGKIVTIDSALSSGDRVEILTSQNSKGPNLDWLKMAKTSQAKNKINQWFKKENREENIAKGLAQLQEGAKKKNLLLEELATPANIGRLLQKISYSDWEGVCAAVGYGGLREGQVVSKLYEEYLVSKGTTLEKEKIAKQLIDVEKIDDGRHREKTGKRSGITVQGVGDINVRLSKCCSPVPGDEIVGFVTRGRGVSIHRTDCVNIINLNDFEKHRVIEAQWSLPEKSGTDYSFRADLKLECDDRSSLLFDISKIFMDERMEMSAMNVRTVKETVIFNISITIKTKEQLEKITQKLLQVKGVHSAERVTV